jgi:hypothetical protein
MTRIRKWFARMFRRWADRLDGSATVQGGPGGGPGAIDR